MPCADALASLIRAGVAATRGDKEQALALVTLAENGLEQVHMSVYGAAARRRRGELTGGEEGRALVESADAFMRDQTIQNPARMTALIAAGRWD